MVHAHALGVCHPVDPEIFVIKNISIYNLFRRKIKQWKILCSVRQPIPILVAIVWQRKSNYTKILQAIYFTGKSISIYGIAYVDKVYRLNWAIPQGVSGGPVQPCQEISTHIHAHSILPFYCTAAITLSFCACYCNRVHIWQKVKLALTLFPSLDPSLPLRQNGDRQICSQWQPGGNKRTLGNQNCPCVLHRGRWFCSRHRTCKLQLSMCNSQFHWETDDMLETSWVNDHFQDVSSPPIHITCANAIAVYMGVYTFIADGTREQQGMSKQSELIPCTCIYMYILTSGWDTIQLNDPHT